VQQANFLFWIWNAIWKRKLACRTLYIQTHSLIIFSKNFLLLAWIFFKTVGISNIVYFGYLAMTLYYSNLQKFKWEPCPQSTSTATSNSQASHVTCCETWYTDHWPAARSHMQYTACKFGPSKCPYSFPNFTVCRQTSKSVSVTNAGRQILPQMCPKFGFIQIYYWHILGI
jgi:hypothetical protein